MFYGFSIVTFSDAIQVSMSIIPLFNFKMEICGKKQLTAKFPLLHTSYIICRHKYECGGDNNTELR